MTADGRQLQWSLFANQQPIGAHYAELSLVSHDVTQRAADQSEAVARELCVEAYCWLAGFAGKS
jgi:hypothetical protein